MSDTDQAEIAEQIRAFGGNLRRARRRAGLTQVQLSASAPLDRAAISRLECGERAPDMPTLLRICAALSVAPAHLLRGVGPTSSSRRRPRHDERIAGDPAALFGANLKWARSGAGISQERLALDAKVDRAAISVYENGGRQPNLRTVLKLALKLEIRPDLLLRGIAWSADGNSDRAL
ncbi:MAG TPA: helix-turn-helix transcriptional regulator [Solirubrobacteraceae bacterium]|nr:helix-turn-helix transcriptional regulator [Solirubrobacteraceae bacterium]